MKNMRLISVLCAGCLITAGGGHALPKTAWAPGIPAQAAEDVQRIEWALDADGTLTVSGTGAMDDFDTTDQIPWFAARQSITAVRIGEGVTSVGRNAFRECGHLTQVYLPDGLERIGENAFNCCIALEALDIPDSVTEIQDFAFYSCAFREAVLPRSLETLAASAFENCHAVQAFEIAENPRFRSEDGILFSSDGTELLAYPPARTDAEVIVPEHVRVIGGYAFNHALASRIVLPENTEEIGHRAFLYCTALTDLVFPSHPVTMGRNAFDYSGYLDRIRGEDGFAVANSGMLLEAPALSGDVTLPERIRFLSGDAVRNLNCTSLTVPDGCTVLPQTGAEMTGLTHLVIGQDCTLESRAFANCRLLTDVQIGSGTVFTGNVFLDCAQLTALDYDRPDLTYSFADAPAHSYHAAESRLITMEPGTVLSGTLSRTHGQITGEADRRAVFNNGFYQRSQQKQMDYPDTVQELTDADGNIYAAFGFEDRVQLFPYDAQKPAVTLSAPALHVTAEYLREQKTRFGAAAISAQNEVFVYWSVQYQKGETTDQDDAAELNAIQNHEENNVIAKYDLNGNLLGSCGFDINDTHSLTPLDTYNANLLVRDGVAACLFCSGRTRNTAHSPDHVYHQSCIMIAADTETMQPVYVNMLPASGSHTFGVQMIPTDTGVAAIGHNDGERGFGFLSWEIRERTLVPDYPSRSGRRTLFRCSGTAKEDGNAMYLHIGGFAASASTYAAAGRSQRYYTAQTYKNLPQAASEYYDVFVTVNDQTLCGDGHDLAGEPRTDAQTGETADRNVIWLTENDAHRSAGEVKIVTLEDGAYCVLWEQYTDKAFDSIHYVILDERGFVLRQETEIRGARLSSSSVQPIVQGSRLVWAVTDEITDTFVWYTVDLNRFADPDSGAEYPEELRRMASAQGVTLSAENTKFVMCGLNQYYAYCKAEKTLLIAGSSAPDVRWSSSTPDVETVCIGEQIALIGAHAFAQCRSLCRVILPESLREIGAYAFNECAQLKQIHLPQGLEIIADNAFRGTALEAAVIPASVQRIGDYAFLTETDCMNDICILNPETEFGTSAFGKYGLTSIFQGLHLTVYGYADSTARKYMSTLAPDTVFVPISGQCGDHAFWAYNASEKALHIYGSGLLYAYPAGAEPWAGLEIRQRYGILETEPYLRGDVNGDGEVNIADAVLLARLIAEDPELPASILRTKAADLNSDSIVTLTDHAALLRRLANIRS